MHRARLVQRVQARTRVVIGNQRQPVIVVRALRHVLLVSVVNAHTRQRHAKDPYWVYVASSNLEYMVSGSEVEFLPCHISQIQKTLPLCNKLRPEEAGPTVAR